MLLKDKLEYLIPTFETIDLLSFEVCFNCIPEGCTTSDTLLWTAAFNLNCLLSQKKTRRNTMKSKQFVDISGMQASKSVRPRENKTVVCHGFLFADRTEVEKGNFVP